MKLKKNHITRTLHSLRFQLLMLCLVLCNFSWVQGQEFGIDSLSLWWKSGEVYVTGNTNPSFFDINVNRVSAWHTIPTYRFPIPFTITQSTHVNRPVFYKGVTTTATDFPGKFNFNNYVKFEGNQALINHALNYASRIGTTPTIFMVATARNDGSTFIAAYNGQNYRDDALQIKNSFRVQKGRNSWGWYTNLSSATASHTHYTNQQPRIFGLWSSTANNNSSTRAFLNEFINSTTTNGNSDYWPDVSPSSTFYLGSRQSLQEAMDDDIAEVLIFNRILTQSEIRIITTYLAVKYGITLKDNYVTQQGITAYEYNTHTGFNNNITAVARDNVWGSVNNDLYQKKSRSINPNGFLTLYMGGTASLGATMNQSVDISSGVNQRNYIFIGDNDATTNLNRLITATHFTDYTENVLHSMGRTWKMVHYAPISDLHDKVSIYLKPEDYAGAANLHVIVADDANFTTNVVHHPLTPNSGFGEWYYYIFDNNTDATGIGQIDIPSGKYFTLGELAIIPEFELDTLCENDPVFTFPGTSDNNISGTWNPISVDPSNSTITAWLANPANTGPYIFEAIFTPNPGLGSPQVTVPIYIFAQPTTGPIIATP
ncbi:MAG: hypothetical protein Q4F57_10025 [Weeksellaceae bacterium]|nr:hypothetical protein [Weeksellaceae bacterium]